MRTSKLQRQGDEERGQRIMQELSPLPVQVGSFVLVNFDAYLQLGRAFYLDLGFRRGRRRAEGVMGLKPEYPRLLSGLSADLSTKLFANAKPQRLAGGEILFRAGASDDGCYRVEDGLLKVTIISGSGAERILAFLGPGAIVGELSIIDGLPRSATVMAVRDTTVCNLGRAEFEAFAEKYPEVYKSLVKLLAKRLRETDTTVAAGSFLSLKGRVARTMLELAEHFGQEVGPGRIVIRQKIGQNDLAAMAGIARENVTRVLNDWQRHKVLSRLSGYYCIENKAQLDNQVKL